MESVYDILLQDIQNNEYDSLTSFIEQDVSFAFTKQGDEAARDLIVPSVNIIIETLTLLIYEISQKWSDGQMKLISAFSLQMSNENQDGDIIADILGKLPGVALLEYYSAFMKKNVVGDMSDVKEFIIQDYSLSALKAYLAFKYPAGWNLYTLLYSIVLLNNSHNIPFTYQDMTLLLRILSQYALTSNEAEQIVSAIGNKVDDFSVKVSELISRFITDDSVLPKYIETSPKVRVPRGLVISYLKSIYNNENAFVRDTPFDEANRVMCVNLGLISETTEMTDYLEKECLRIIYRYQKIQNPNLLVLIGPVNLDYMADLSIETECGWFGGCRMFLCRCYDRDNEDGEVDLDDDFNWFTGSCQYCSKTIPFECYASRIPDPSGSWRGCYCSDDCIVRDVNSTLCQFNDVEREKISTELQFDAGDELGKYLEMDHRLLPLVDDIELTRVELNRPQSACTESSCEIDGHCHTGDEVDDTETRGECDESYTLDQKRMLAKLNYYKVWLNRFKLADREDIQPLSF